MMILDGKNMTTRKDAHDEIARVLELPDYYGRNLDALWDLLGERQWQITLINSADMLGALGAYGSRLLKTFRESETVTWTEN